MNNKKTLVVDTSVAIKWLNKDRENFLDRADNIIRKAQTEEIVIVMPELSKYEIGNALLYKNSDLPLLETVIEDFYNLPIEFIGEDLEIAQKTVEIAYKNNITYYDASFISLAEKLKAVLVTDNPKHQKKFPGVLIKVVNLKDY